MNYCLRILVLDRPAVLARVAGQVARRGVNINHFTARNIEGGKTVITIGMDIDAALADRLDKAMARLIDVLEVTLTEDGGLEPPEMEPPCSP
jgi:acetolactate synthase small subunit